MKFPILDGVQIINANYLLGIDISGLTPGGVWFSGSDGSPAVSNNFIFDDINNELKVKGDIYGGSNLTELNLLPSIADGGSALAYKYDTENSLVTAGANHSQWLNNTSTLMTLDKDGNLDIAADLTAIDGTFSGNIDGGFTLGSVIFEGANGLTEDNANLFWDVLNKRLGVNTNTPEQVGIHVIGNVLSEKEDGTAGQYTIKTYRNSSGHSNINLQAFRGTKSSPTPLLLGDIIGRYLWRGADDTSGVAQNGARIDVATSENWSATNRGTIFKIDLISTGTTSFIERFRIDGVGNVGIGTDVPDSQIHVLNDGAVTSMRLENFRNNSIHNNFRFTGSWGTKTTPLIVQDGDVIGKFTATAYDGNDIGSRLAEIRYEIDGTPGLDDMPGRLVFATTPSGSAVTTDRMVIKENGNVGIGTTTPGTKLDVIGDISVGGSNNELRFYEGANYVGFEAPALTADQIWVLPNSDGTEGDVLGTDGTGNLKWASNASEKSFFFSSPSATSGDFFYGGGFYSHASTDNDFSPSITWGTSNASYAAHFYVVLGAIAVDEITITITGTSITDAGVRTVSDTQTIVIPDTTAVDTYYETSKKWIGQITVETTAGTAKTCNYGWAKYWDNNNSDFTVKGLEAVWLGGGNDSGANIKILHHRPTGWTFNSAAPATPPAEIAAMATDHSTESEIRNGEEGAWKRDNLDEDIAGSNGEGTLLEVTTSTNRTFESGTFLLRIVPQ